MGQRSEAVDHALTEVGELLFVGDSVEFAIEQHAFAAAWDVAFGKISVEVALHVAFIDKLRCIDVERCRYLVVGCISNVGRGGVEVGEFFVLEFRNGLRKDFLIRFVAQVCDETALFGT